MLGDTVCSITFFVFFLRGFSWFSFTLAGCTRGCGSFWGVGSPGLVVREPTGKPKPFFGGERSKSTSKHPCVTGVKTRLFCGPGVAS